MSSSKSAQTSSKSIHMGYKPIINKFGHFLMSLSDSRRSQNLDFYLVFYASEARMTYIYVIDDQKVLFYSLKFLIERISIKYSIFTLFEFSCT